MKTLIAAAIRCSLIFLIPTATYAISAQWDLDPISGDWNTAANWTPNGVPNGPADTATFGLSHTTDVSISTNTEVNGITFTSAATNPYNITVNPGLTLTISGVGIVNNSGVTQNFVTHADTSGNVGTIVFSTSATAGSHVFIRNDGGSTNFFNRSTAGGASISNEAGGSTNFFNRSTAGGASISSGSTNFFNRSSAGNADIQSFSGPGDLFVSFFDSSSAANAAIQFSGGSVAGFFDHSTAGHALIIAFGGTVSFADRSTAGSASIRITDEGILEFTDTSSAGNANLGSAGFVSFFDSSTAGSAFIGDRGFLYFFGSSQGGTAQIELQFSRSSGIFGSLDISGHNAPGVTIGSLAGDEGEEGQIGRVFLGANNLTVGSNNLSTTFPGVIQDGGQNGGVGGSLTKIGSGTLTLTGADTYTGDTNVNRGVLQVDGSIASNTFVNRRGTLAGTGTINGNVTNYGRVNPGALGAPGMLTVVHDYTQAQYATLMIQIAGASSDQFSVLNVLGSANLTGVLDPVLLNGFVPMLGDSFSFLNYGSLTGQFAHIRHRIFDHGMLQWSVSYEANHAILTVEQHVPDQGSTFLLLALSLLGLVTFRQQLVRKQS